MRVWAGVREHPTQIGGSQGGRQVTPSHQKTSTCNIDNVKPVRIAHDIQIRSAHCLHIVQTWNCIGMGFRSTQWSDFVLDRSPQSFTGFCQKKTFKKHDSYYLGRNGMVNSPPSNGKWSCNMFLRVVPTNMLQNNLYIWGWGDSWATVA